LKVGFANEIGGVCKAVGIDGHEVMDIFCRDRKLNISPTYLKPGFAFGGMCLPKDLRALLAKAAAHDVPVPILNAVLPSNQQQLERGVRAVIDAGREKVGILGLSFKAGTDDLRESPVVELAERLLGKGFDLRVYDRNVNMARVIGTNRDYVLNKIPHISRLMVPSVDALLTHAQTIVIGNRAPEFRNVPRSMSEGQVLVDLVRISDMRSVAGVYEGISW
jgi:GDP-mannose 6-dehydrogenase